MPQESRRICQNSDNDYLFPRGHEGCVIGYVDEVNGEGAEEVTGFKPTRHELLQLVKYWYGRLLDINWSYFVYAQTGSTEIRLGPFAQRRVNRAAAVIGEDAVGKAIEEVRNDFKAKVDARLWEIFENGNLKQWEAVRDEIERASRK